MDDCNICFLVTASPGHTVAMFQGEIVDEDTTQEWAGMPVCVPCHNDVGRLYIITGHVPTVEEVAHARDARQMD